MAVSMVIRGATLGEAFAELFAVLYDTVKKVGNKDCSFKPHIKNLEPTLDRLLPIVKDIQRSINQIDLSEKKRKSLIEEMKMGETLIRKRSKKRWWNCCFKFCCPTELSELNEDIARFCKDDLEANSTRNDETEISMNLNIITLEKEDSSNLDRPRAFCAVRRPPNFTVGFDVPMMELKTLLLKEEVKQLLLTAPAGCGKTTLVQMLCQDNQIKGTSYTQLISHKSVCDKFRVIITTLQGAILIFKINYKYLFAIYSSCALLCSNINRVFIFMFC